MSKILYAASTMSHINNFHKDYIAALRDEGHEVLTMAKGEGADFDIPFEKKMISKQNFAICKQIKAILKKEKFDAVVLNTTLAAFYIRLAMPRKNRPRVINIVHGYLFGSNTGFFHRTILLACEKLVRKKTDVIMIMNREDYRIAKSYNLALERVRTSLGMGASVTEDGKSSEEIRCELEAVGAWVLVFVGELSDRKNQKMLISAMPNIKKNIPNAQLWLVGEGDARGELELLCDKLGVASSVVFLGQRDNPCDFIRAADIYVSASRIEGMPFNIIEALGCGKTIVASDVKGHRDLIVEGVSGFLYPEGDISLFVSKVTAYKLGMLSVCREDILAKYENYEKSYVFEKTYSALKEELKLDCEA